MKKVFSNYFWIISFIIINIVFGNTAVLAAVGTTTENAAAYTTIYVAGNPDCYPVEYYDQKTKCYEGVLPTLLKEISDRTGMDFTYINASHSDHRLSMARNCQAEIISAVTDQELDQVAGISFSEPILSFKKDGQDCEVRLAFTAIASQTLQEKMTEALNTVSQSEISAMILEQSSRAGRPDDRSPQLILQIMILMILLVLTVIILFFCVKLQRRNRADQMTDVLTGIGNRNYFEYYFQHHISEQFRALYVVAYIAFDIEKVKNFYGEAKAEEQLRFAANELSEYIGDNDFTGRVGDAGFAVAHICSGEENVKQWISSILLRLNKYCIKFGIDYCPYFSAGVYMMKSSDRSCTTVLYNAQQGYRHAIEQNVPFVISNAKMLREEQERKILLNSLNDAVNKRQFQLFLQCIVDGQTGMVCGAEALSRWDHPKQGLLRPGNYIELLEKEGKISELDYYMFEETCCRLQNWGNKGLPLYISCNFARVTICREDFIEQIEAIIKKYYFDHRRLILELTEDTLETNKSTTFHNIARCQKMGFRIALDDVGSGYTSFSDLRDYMIDIVKIDRSILSSAVNEKGIALLQGMISFVHNLGIEVLCEGVETEQQFEMLRNMGCDYMQGYYFYRPVPYAEVEKYIR